MPSWQHITYSKEIRPGSVRPAGHGRRMGPGPQEPRRDIVPPAQGQARGHPGHDPEEEEQGAVRHGRGDTPRVRRARDRDRQGEQGGPGGLRDTPGQGRAAEQGGDAPSPGGHRQGRGRPRHAPEQQVHGPQEGGGQVHIPDQVEDPRGDTGSTSSPRGSSRSARPRSSPRAPRAGRPCSPSSTSTGALTWRRARSCTSRT